VRAWAQRDYGNRVGIWRPMDLLSRHGVRASPTLNSDICDHHPQIVRTAIEFGWEIRGHNQTNSVWLDQLSREEERQTIAGTLSRIAEMTGRKPVGWLVLPRPGTRSIFWPGRVVCTLPTGSTTTSLIS
jgi:peptidoglycan/xylan/chitin deacetylase (PgdA/CDA1 family)